MQRILYYFIWVLCLGLFVVGCRLQDPVASPQTHLVVINSMQFQPKNLTVRKGDTVIWENRGWVQHNVVAFPESSWRSSTLQPGERWIRTMSSSTEYFCNIHPMMKGKINVVE